MQFYAADKWQVTSDLTLDLGLRYEPVTSPVEVNGFDRDPLRLRLQQLRAAVRFRR